jgi:multiple sugar transport system ATP-binding protein
MTRIRLENITKTFGADAVIKELNITIKEGEFFTFVGPSGCGKSTILNMIAGLEAPTDGLIFFNERLVNAFSPKERDVAMVFQSYALYPHMTVRSNIAFPLVMRKERKEVIEAEVFRVAGLLGLGDFLEKKPKELSGGQRQRVALGRAIIRKPKVFLMDEPLSNLDARLRIDMRAELKKLHQALGITTVYVTHDHSEAMGLSDRIAVLNKGQVQQCETPRTVYRDPANTFVAGFIGSPAMNFIPAEIAGREPLRVRCLGIVVANEAAQSHTLQEVIAGIRPEDIRVTSQKNEGAMEGIVVVVEPAGPLQWVDLTVAGKTVKGFASPEEELRPGSRAFAHVRPNTVILFDVETGARL